MSEEKRKRGKRVKEAAQGLDKARGLFRKSSAFRQQFLVAAISDGIEVNDVAADALFDVLLTRFRENPGAFRKDFDQVGSLFGKHFDAQDPAPDSHPYGRVNPDKRRHDTDDIVSKFLREGRVRVDAGSLDASELETAEHFENSLDKLTTAVKHVFRSFPEPLLQHLDNQDQGTVRVVVSSHTSKPAVYERSSRTIYVMPEILRQDQGAFEEEVVHLFDHLLGEGSSNLSEGQTRHAKLAPIAGQIQRLYQQDPMVLGNYAGQNPRELLAHAVRLYLTDEQELKNRSLELYSLVKERFLNGAFWDETLP